VKTRRFRIVNVFTREGRLTGNPLAVFEDGEGLDDATMQALARQFNLSETTFILPSERATARVRIFTPAYEMPFAGHPTLGTAHVVRALKGTGDAVKLEMKAGIIPVAAQGDRWTLVARTAKVRAVDETPAAIAEALGLAEADLGGPLLWVNSGTEQLMVPLAAPEALARALPRPDAALKLRTAEPPKAYVFHDEGDASGRVNARFFFPSGTSFLEDPATGSACANLGGWFTHTRPGEDVERVVFQGEAVARPSTLRLSVRGGTVFVGGDVIELGHGSLEL
jgi:PhzF family phenazine biosynthesis protein